VSFYSRRNTYLVKGVATMKNKLIWIIPLTISIVALIILFRPAGRITFDKSVSENRILFQYEIVGCGSVVGKVVDGGTEITSKYIEQYTDIGVDEVVFSEQCDEPRKHINEADFFGGGLAEKYTYVIEGSPVGVTRGASDCCEPVPAYNENVVEFKVDKWYFTSYVPYVEVGNPLTVCLTFVVLFLTAGWLLLLIIAAFVDFIKSKIG